MFKSIGEFKISNRYVLTIKYISKLKETLNPCEALELFYHPIKFNNKIAILNNHF